MGKRDNTEAGSVSWVDLQTPDPARARAFYGAVLGWTFVGGEDPETGFYSMAQVDGNNVAGMVKLSANSKFAPMWSIYIATLDADRTARKVSDAGGQVVIPPMDVLDLGRMAYFADATGAHFGVWQAKQHAGAQLVDDPGATTWFELYTRDAGRACDFYARVFGVEAARLDVQPMNYWRMNRGSTTVFGIMDMRERFPDDVRAHWNTYFAVSDTDAAVARVIELGGNLSASAFDSAYGRMAMVQDPFGAGFCLIQPEVPAGRPDPTQS